MISFDDTEKAFISKSDSDLIRSYRLFKIIGNPTIVKLGAFFTPLALNLHLPIKGIIRKTIYKQFVGGENIEDCNKTIEELGKFNIGTILDYSVEGKESETDFEACAKETIETIHRAKNDEHIPFCVFKVTGLARFGLLEKVSAKQNLNAEEKNEWEQVRQRVHNICEQGFKNSTPIFIDAEESWIQQAIDDLVNENKEKFNKEKAIIYNTYQLYRHDRFVYLEQCIKHAKENNYHIGAKLVRGAYMEKERKRAVEMGYPSPIQSNKNESDKDYNLALELCIENLAYVSVCAGTHNEQSSLILVDLMAKNNIAKDDKRVYFSQLLGMSDHISYNLSVAGYNVAKYVPYGPVKEVLPYLLRRAKENTSVKGQTGRELSLIIKEKARRKVKK
ncbi:MAG TPA: proline dehydrogenase family protein [Bacteroidia bacterium]|jgi:proline dehydrogenase|nr:proline dehydrogenase family protein [Bacteroidia bacterium]